MFKNMAVWLVIGLVLMTVFNQFNTRQPLQPTMEYSQFMDEVTHGSITKVVIEGRVLKATTSDGRTLTSYAPPDLWMVSDLLKHGVKVEARCLVLHADQQIRAGGLPVRHRNDGGQCYRA